ncbi:Hypothetical_protein [Hexamita inflata]|uniref:Hypothetical_protein n=1 Tax=Hexamita inflata TaxID=28002 RepID=A0AA86NSK4_9EUKA|nr:Hypothetical protein HINF_LOCUS11780 [Hexamita inflata]
MLFNLGQITRSPVQILDLCSKFESIILPSQDRNALKKQFKVTSLARSGFFLEQMILQNYILFKSKGKLESLPAYNIRPLYHDNDNQQEMVLEQELLLLQCSDNLISLNSHEEMIILRECLGRLNIPLILKDGGGMNFQLSENMNQIQWMAILVIEAKLRSNLAREIILKNLQNYIYIFYTFTLFIYQYSLRIQQFNNFYNISAPNQCNLIKQSEVKKN